MILGFIIRNCKDFTDPIALKTLFTSLVRAKLEYNSVIWSPYKKYQIHCLENVQNRFIRFLAFKCNVIRESHSPYQPLLNLFQIDCLSDRRKLIDLKFLFKLVNGYTDCPELLSCLNFNVPQRRTRSTNIFYICSQRTNYSLSSPINRIMSLANETNIDLFNFTSLESFNNYVNRFICF